MIQCIKQLMQGSERYSKYTCIAKQQMATISHTLGLLVALSATCLISSAAPTLDLCAGCTMINGAGYNSHPTDCDKFVHCHIDGVGRLIGEVQQCAFGTMWNMDLLTCVPAEEIYCKADKCKGVSNGEIRDGIGNCRGYWECANERSLPKCCPQGQFFNETLNTCENNTDEYECTDSCFNEIYVPDIDVTTTQKPCLKYAIANLPSWYQEEIAGWGLITRPCAFGTEFDQIQCDCVSAVVTVPPATCKPEIYLPFTHDHSDQSGKRNYVENRNVEIVNGVAKFNGLNSSLIIHRFTNLDANTIVVKVKYSSKHNDIIDAQAVLSNNDCDIEPAIKITEDNQNVMFTVGTHLTTDLQTTVEVPQVPMGPLQETAHKDAIYRFVNGQLSGQVGTADAVTSQAPGKLRKVHCALHVGHAQDAKPFFGEIDELTIYLCDPDSKP